MMPPSASRKIPAVIWCMIGLMASEVRMFLSRVTAVCSRFKGESLALSIRNYVRNGVVFLFMRQKLSIGER